ncbi:Ovostatin 2 [Manis pentadactyla]|nr:Ovostatin 2 [Manis pentadactyla]
MALGQELLCLWQGKEIQEYGWLALADTVVCTERPFAAEPESLPEEEESARRASGQGAAAAATGPWCCRRLLRGRDGRTRRRQIILLVTDWGRISLVSRCPMATATQDLNSPG